MERSPEDFRQVADLPEDSFVGTNNIRSYLLGYLTFENLKELTFKGFKLRADGRWDVWR